MPTFNRGMELLPKIYENLEIDSKLPEIISVCGFPVFKNK
jgi:hypothetical protein